jgi:hypothetical protein
MEYPIFTPTITPDDTAYEAAYQLQQLWDEKELAVQIRIDRMAYARGAIRSGAVADMMQEISDELTIHMG